MRLAVAASVILLAGSSIAGEKKPNRLSDDVTKVLEAATTLEILALDYSEKSADRLKHKDDKDRFHTWKVRGKTEVDDPELVKQLREELLEGVSEATNGAKCFLPGYGVRATADGKTVDLAICYSCQWIRAYHSDSKMDEKVATTAKAQETLERILRRANIVSGEKIQPDE